MSKDFRYDLDQLTKMFPKGHGHEMRWEGDPFGNFKLITNDFRIFYEFEEGRLISIKDSGGNDSAGTSYVRIEYENSDSVEKGATILSDRQVDIEISCYKGEYAKQEAQKEAAVAAAAKTAHQQSHRTETRA